MHFKQCRDKMCVSNWNNALHKFECSSAHSEAVEFVEAIA